MTAQTTTSGTNRGKSDGLALLRYFNAAIPVFVWLTPLGSGLLSLHMGKSMAWDLLHYHYYNGYAFLNDRLGYDIVPAVFHTFLNPALDIAFYAGVEALPARAVGFILGAIHGVNVIMLFHCARLVLGPRVRGFAAMPNLLPGFLAVAGFGTAAAMGTLGSWHHDLIASLFFLGALLILLARPAAGVPRAPKLLRPACAGLVVGIGLGLKLTLAPFVLAIVAAPLAAAGRVRDRMLACVAAGAAAGMGLMLSAGFWMARMQAEFGNPFFPFFNRLFESPFAGAGEGRDLRYLPADVLEYLVYPVLFSFDGDRISEAPWRDFRLLAAFAVAIALLAAALTNRMVRWRLNGGTFTGPNARMLLWTALVGYAGWLVLFSIYRYAVPLEMLVPLLLCVMLVALFGTRAGVYATGACCLLLVMTTSKADFARRDWGDDPFVGASVPTQYRGLRDAVILMAGRSADAHFIPAFDPSNRFIRLDGFDYVYRAGNPFTRQAAAIVSGHEGPVFGMFRRDRRGQGVESTFRSFGFAIQDASCAKVESSVRPPEPTFLCRLAPLGSG
ncbi:hypothetical protein [Skermanella pratensis]|uniref:hypothetical protein n=1 Tax=Skermanella pratensis TaxID=2233999 RepID=UPI001301589B|nr:hypothetical protein [Skermanella pratensis]